MNDPNFKELLIRWFQFGTFCPVMRIHGSRQPHSPIYKKDGEETEPTGAANEIWSYGIENEEIMKKFIAIREMMRPYTKDLMKQAHENGSPVLRPLFYEFQEDPRCWEEKTEYLYGPDILVAPVVEAHATTRTVYLPRGAKWVDAQNGEEYEGGQQVEVRCPLDTLPVFLRDGRQEYLINKI